MQADPDKITCKKLSRAGISYHNSDTALLLIHGKITESVIDMSKSNLILYYWYLEGNFLVPENFLWNSSSFRLQELKCQSEEEIQISLNGIQWDDDNQLSVDDQFLGYREFTVYKTSDCVCSLELALETFK